MKNVIIYSTKKTSQIADMLSGLEDANIRIEAAQNLKDYETLNPEL